MRIHIKILLSLINRAYKELAPFARSLLAPVSKHMAYFTHTNLACIASSVDMRILYVSSDAPAIADNVHAQSMNRKKSPMSYELQRQTSALQRNKLFCAGVDSLLVTSRPYARTDNYNFSRLKDHVVSLQS